MVQRQSIDRAFAALADPTRRQVLERLGDGAATVTELAAPAGISLTGMKKHLGVLEEAGLVRSEKAGRSRRCKLGPQRLDDVLAWIDDYRQTVEERFDRLGELLDREQGGSR
jgi:DNA-binding transcriptional ArsR family regulator